MYKLKDIQLSWIHPISSIFCIIATRDMGEIHRKTLPILSSYECGGVNFSSYFRKLRRTTAQSFLTSSSQILHAPTKISLFPHLFENSARSNGQGPQWVVLRTVRSIATAFIFCIYQKIQPVRMNKVFGGQFRFITPGRKDQSFRDSSEKMTLVVGLYGFAAIIFRYWK